MVWGIVPFTVIADQPSGSGQVWDRGFLRRAYLVLAGRHPGKHLAAHGLEGHEAPHPRGGHRLEVVVEVADQGGEAVGIPGASQKEAVGREAVELVRQEPLAQEGLASGGPVRQGRGFQRGAMILGGEGALDPEMELKGHRAGDGIPRIIEEHTIERGKGQSAPPEGRPSC